MTRWLVTYRYVCKDNYVIEAKTKAEAIRIAQYGTGNAMEDPDVCTTVIRSSPIKAKKFAAEK